MRQSPRDLPAAILIGVALIHAACVTQENVPTELTQAPVERQADSQVVTATGSRPRVEPAPFPEAPGRSLVIAHCTGCHSARLVQQNRATRTGWQEIIRWMRANHGFWSLEPEVEDQILDYLATTYGPDGDGEDGRRPGIAPALMPPHLTTPQGARG